MNDDIAQSIAAEHTRQLEGFRSAAYLCPACVWTVGYGQTGPDVREGVVWSLQHAEARLRSSIAMFHAAAKKTWPGAERLHPKAQAALILLAYNRGTSLTKKADDALDRRREMRELQSAVAARDYAQMARLIGSMKRLWVGKGMDGLLTRRDLEAELCTQAAEEVAGLGDGRAR